VRPRAIPGYAVVLRVGNAPSNAYARGWAWIVPVAHITRPSLPFTLRHLGIAAYP